MSTTVQRGLPPDLQLGKTSFYSRGSSVVNVSCGTHRSYEYVAFDYDSQSGDMSHTETIVAIKTDARRIPDTNLSHASGLRLERVDEWVFAFEPRRMVYRDRIQDFVNDIINLFEYAKDCHQSE